MNGDAPRSVQEIAASFYTLVRGTTNKGSGCNKNHDYNVIGSHKRFLLRSF
jgi:hypothetical protein